MNAPQEMPRLCSFGCGTIIRPDRDWQRTKGWTTKRAQGGANTIAMREVIPDEWACMHCIDALKAGRNPQQGALV